MKTNNLFKHLLLLLFLLTTSMTASAQEAYACYTSSNQTLTFYYDNLRSSRPGKTYNLITGLNSPAWLLIRQDVTSVVFDSSFANARPTSTYQWFGEMKNLTSITGIANLNTSEVTTMSEMFSNCSALTTIDLSHFNTAKVTGMRDMFSNCSSLTSINLSSFNTANVTTMGYMFENCSSLTSLDVSNFNTAKVEYMAGMFEKCENLHILDLSSFNTARVRFMSEMFSSCKVLRTIYVSTDWSTSSVTKSANMFNNCIRLVGSMGTLYDRDHVDDAYAHIDGGTSNPGYFTAEGTEPWRYDIYAYFTSSSNTLTFYYDTQRNFRSGTTYDLNVDEELPGWYTDGTYAHVTGVIFDSSFANVRPKTTAFWFRGMSKLKTFKGMVYLNTSEVTNMCSMYEGCRGLTSLDVSRLNTSNVHNMQYMFLSCSGLTSLDVSSLNTSNVFDMSGMFYGCSGLTSLDLSSFDTSNVSFMDNMFRNCSSLTSLDLSGFNTAKVRVMRHMFSACSSLPYLDLSSFNTAKVSDMEAMFEDCDNLQILDLSNFNTRNLRNMDNMFFACNNLTSIDLSSFNTDSVTNMKELFALCPNLRTIYASTSFNTYSLQDRELQMFRGCTSLVGGQGTTYDDNNYDDSYAHIDGGPNYPGYFTAVPTEPEAYAFYTSSNTTLTFCYDTQRRNRMGTTYDLNTGSNNPGWVTDGTNAVVTKVSIYSSFSIVLPTSTYNWFGGMAELETIKGISNLYTSEVTNMAHMFDGCGSLESLNVSGFNTSNVTDMSNMFAGCGSLESLDVSGFNTAKVTNMSCMFKDCSSVANLDVSGFNTAKVTNMSNMFYSCALLSSLDVSGFNTQNVTDMSDMFAGCGGVLSLDVTGFNTAKVTNMRGMFRYGTRLRILNLCSFNTMKVTDMEMMFQSCINLHTIYVGDGWKTVMVTSSQNMFENSNRIVGGQGTTYSYNHIDKEYAHIDGGTSNPGYFTDIHAKMPYACYTPSNTTLTFYCDTQRGSRSGKTYDVNTGTDDPGWETDGTYAVVTQVVFDPSFADARPSYTRYWFCGMENLESITGISYLNTSEVTNMAHMFDGCSSLKALDVSGFNTSNVTDMSCMFRYCDIVDSLDVSGFNTKYVKYMDNMFYNCYLLRSLDVSGFDTRNVTDMSGMFASCGGVANFDVSGFNTAKVTNMRKMFMYCNRLRSLDLSSFNTAKVTDMEMMFQSCINLHTIYAGDGWSTAAVTSSQNMFFYCKWIEGSQGTTYNSGHVDKEYARIDGGLSDPGYFSEKPFAYAVYNNGTLTFYYDNQRDSRTGTTYDLNEGSTVPAWYSDNSSASVTKVVFHESFADVWPTSTYGWFTQMANLTSITGIENLDTREVTTMRSMFNNCSSLTSIDLSHFNTKNVTSMRQMFLNCENLTSLDLSNFNTAKVTDMYNMFGGCSGLTSIDLSNFNTAKVTDMGYMFSWCTSLTSLDLRGLDTKNVTNMGFMFYKSSNLTSIDLSSFNTAKVTAMDRMFSGCTSLTTVYAGENWSTAAVNESDYMFTNCTNIKGGMGTTHDPYHVDAEYAHVDGGASNPGYFTFKAAFLPGDVNGDDKVDVADVTALTNHLLGTGGSFNEQAADVNLSGSVTIADTKIIVEYLLGKIELENFMNRTEALHARMASIETSYEMAKAELESKDSGHVQNALWQMASEIETLITALQEQLESVSSEYDVEVCQAKENELQQKIAELNAAIFELQ